MSHHSGVARAIDQHKGIFITVDGPNGVGKSSIVSGVANRLRQSGFDVLETFEPTSTPLGQFIRQAEADYDGKTYACLIAADRYHHLEYEVIPALKAGKIVLSARYVESSLVLQRLDGLDINFIWSLNNLALVPNLSIILTASPEVLNARLQERHRLSRFERMESRKDELAYYLDAATFLVQYGYNMTLLDNEINTLETNINQISDKIINQLLCQ